MLDVRSVSNCRELGGYDTPDGATRWRRFLRAGSTSHLTSGDLNRLCAYGVTHVIDLRGPGESPALSDAFARARDVTWVNVPLYGHDLSDPRLVPPEGQTNYLTSGYLTMLANHGGMREIFEFIAAAPREACVLFHCAAGMDRTGMLAMLLLGLAGVSRQQVVADYAYSFDTVERVDRAVRTGEYPALSAWSQLPMRVEAISIIYDTVVSSYGGVRSYLEACGISEEALEAVRAHLLG